MPWLAIWWVSSLILVQQRSTCSAGQPSTCPIRCSLGIEIVRVIVEKGWKWVVRGR